MGGYKETYIKCPFYRNNDSYKNISCEGIAEDSIMTTTFKNTKDMKQQVEIFCCDYYKNCEIYRMLMDNKY